MARQKPPKYDVDWLMVKILRIARKAGVSTIEHYSDHGTIPLTESQQKKIFYEPHSESTSHEYELVWEEKFSKKNRHKQRLKKFKNPPDHD